MTSSLKGVRTPDWMYLFDKHIGKYNFTMIFEVKNSDNISIIRMAQVQLISYAVALSKSEMAGTHRYILILITPLHFCIGNFCPNDDTSIKFNVYNLFTWFNSNLVQENSDKATVSFQWQNFLSFLVAFDEAVKAYI